MSMPEQGTEKERRKSRENKRQAVEDTQATEQGVRNDCKEGTIDVARRAHWPGARREKLSKTSGQATEEHSDCWANGHSGLGRSLLREHKGLRPSCTDVPDLALWLILFSAMISGLLW